jgi:ABC-2 type transport system ATP-binding protein
MNTDVPNAIEIQDVVQAYGRRRVLDGATLRVPEGATTVLLGENGQGKTTLLRLCLGVLAPKSGTVRVLGLDPCKKAKRVRERVGFVPDKPDVYPWMKLPDLFRFLAPHYPTWSVHRAAQVVEALDVPTDRTFKHMSRGEGMKAMLAAALAPDPDVLLLDEPFAGLDPLVREEVLRQVITAVGDRPRTVLCITHDLDVAARLADRIAVLSKGKVVREGPASEFGATSDDSLTPHALRQAIAFAAGVATVGGR